MKKIDALKIHYRDLNKLIVQALETDGDITLNNVYGQRYIGCGLPKKAKIKIFGTPGNDMGAYMDGAELEIFGNAQDASGNTMNDGKIIIHGSCGDTAGYAMRGGKIYVEKDVGYRAGIHMKEYKGMKPVIVAGGKAGDFLGEYMAGGAIVLLGLDLSKGEDLTGRFCGTGMHGGSIYIRGKAEKYKLGKEAVAVKLEEEDKVFLRECLDSYAKYFKKDLKHIEAVSFEKYCAVNKNPYKNMYCKY